MEIEWGPEIAVDGKRPEWLGDGDVGHTVTICGLETQYPWNTDDSEHIADMGEWVWPDIDAIRLPASHPAYVAIAKGFTPWGGGNEAPGDWDGEEVLLDWGTEANWGDRRFTVCPSDEINFTHDTWSHGLERKRYALIIGYRRKPEAISPQPIGSSTVTGLSIKVDTTELKAAIAATASYTVTRKVGQIEITITGPDLAHILRSIKEANNDPA